MQAEYQHPASHLQGLGCVAVQRGTLINGVLNDNRHQQQRVLVVKGQCLQQHTSQIYVSLHSCRNCNVAAELPPAGSTVMGEFACRCDQQTIVHQALPLAL